MTSRCQTVPWLRDVPKGAHNWFQISQSTVLLISVNGNYGFVHSHTNAQRSPKIRFVKMTKQKKKKEKIEKNTNFVWNEITEVVLIPLVYKVQS